MEDRDRAISVATPAETGRFRSVWEGGQLVTSTGRPRRRPALLALTAAVLLLVLVVMTAVTTSSSNLPGVARDPASDVIGLEFIDHAVPEGPRITDLVPEPGQLMFIYFGYLSCPDVCPMTMADIAAAQRQVGPELTARTRVAFVTLDPDRDDPERLRSYMGNFFGDGHLALTAPDRDLLDQAVQRLGARYEIEPHEPGADRYEVAHSAITYVVDDRGVVVRELPFGTTPTEFAQIIQALLR